MIHPFTIKLVYIKYLVCAWDHDLYHGWGGGGAHSTVNKAATVPIFIEPAAIEEQDGGSRASVW